MNETNRKQDVLPNAPRIEQSVLAMAFIDPEGVLDRCTADGITEEVFYIPAHRLLWSLLRDRHEKGLPIDMALVAQELEDRNQLDTLGGLPGLHDILATETTTAMLNAHLSELKDKHTRRCVILAAAKMTATASAPDSDAATALDLAEQEVLQIRKGITREASWSLQADIKRVKDDFNRMLTGGGAPIGLTTGFPLLDNMSNGLKPGELFVIAARPSVGKSSIMLNMAEHIALTQGKPALIFSLEMPSWQLVSRLLIARSGFNPRELAKNGRSHTRNQISSVKNAAEEIKTCQLIICDKSALTITELRAIARREKRAHPELAAIFVDYLQLMRSTSKQAQGSREREVAEVSSGLKALAKELGLPIVALAQLNRACETRGTGKDKGRPALSDLRESGAIEQDADMVALLHRPSKDGNAEAQDALILAKNRNGQTGDIPLTFIPELTTFRPA